MSLSFSGINVDEVVKVMRQVISMGDDLGLQNSAAWMLGQYYMSASSVMESRASGKCFIYIHYQAKCIHCDSNNRENITLGILQRD